MIGKMKNKALLLSIFLVIVFMYGCTPYFKEGVLKDNRIQQDYIQNLAKQSSDIFDFIQKIYSKPPTVDGKYMIVSKALSESYPWDTDIFKKYCNSKNGKLFSLGFFRNDYAFSGFNGTSKALYACEINKEIDSALIYDGYREYNSYITYKKYAKKEGFYNLISEYKLEGFTSDNKIITIPATQVNKEYVISDKYSFIFYYKNDTDKPQTFDFLNSSYVTIKGIKYDIDFSSATYKKEPINWLFYEHTDASNYGVFVGEEGKKLSKLKFNPKQKIYGEVTFKIPGFTSLKEEDLSNFVIVIDGKTYTNFKKISYYELLKKEVQ